MEKNIFNVPPSPPGKEVLADTPGKAVVEEPLDGGIQARNMFNSIGH